MAKIYETQEDLDRERLHAVADQQGARVTWSISSGLLGAAATAVAYLYPYKALSAAAPMTVLRRSVLNKVAVGAGLTYTALFGVMGYLVSNSQRNKAEGALAALGAEKIKIPTDTSGMQPYIEALTHQPSTDILVGKGSDAEIVRLQENTTHQKSL